MIYLMHDGRPDSRAPGQYRLVNNYRLVDNGPIDIGSYPGIEVALVAMQVEYARIGLKMPWLSPQAELGCMCWAQDDGGDGSYVPARSIESRPIHYQLVLAWRDLDSESVRDTIIDLDFLEEDVVFDIVNHVEQVTGLMADHIGG